jgi:small-conductance mechanosensitive channel
MYIATGRRRARALRSLNIPLIVFTVAGGALAIGFGSQTIINNFASGLILMVERPIKVGDPVGFDRAPGRVERTGPRSTRIRTFDNIHLIVPNGKLLENSVINWTLSDDVIRTRITVARAGCPCPADPAPARSTSRPRRRGSPSGFRGSP